MPYSSEEQRIITEVSRGRPLVEAFLDIELQKDLSAWGSRVGAEADVVRRALLPKVGFDVWGEVVQQTQLRFNESGLMAPELAIYGMGRNVVERLLLFGNQLGSGELLFPDPVQARIIGQLWRAQALNPVEFEQFRPGKPGEAMINEVVSLGMSLEKKGVNLPNRFDVPDVYYWK